MRKYISGSRWALWRWTETDTGYLIRLHVWKTPWFAIDIHWINKPDPEPYLHDHPVTFLSIILRGWYIEQRGGFSTTTSLHTRRWFNFIRATVRDAHRIISVAPGGAITLCFMGPKTREWGFHKGATWIFWKAYYTLQREGWIE